jgi:hypothetical protein
MKWADVSIVPGFFPICKSPGVFCPIRVRTPFKHHMTRCRKPDLIIDAGGLQSLLINSGSGFRSATAAEQQQILHSSGS